MHTPSSLVVFLLAALGAATFPGQARAAASATGAIETQERQAMEAVRELAGRLQAELKQAMKEGGPVHAITICNTRARVIAEEVGSRRKLHIGRVSLRYRNPDNAPTGWERQVLEDFEQQKRDGRPVADLVYTRVSDSGGGRQFRFMKAIPTRAICTMCHGTDIAPAVKKELDRLYPGDRARGFRSGDLRGAFVVTRDLH